MHVTFPSLQVLRGRFVPTPALFPELEASELVSVATARLDATANSPHPLGLAILWLERQ